MQLAGRRPRYLENSLRQALDQKKMAFVGGPRQVGKTTLALSLLSQQAGTDVDEDHPGYLSWDYPAHREALRRGELPPDQTLVVLDEVHKYARWRNLVKGLYDVEKSRRRFVVTGSARLDYYRKGGDSLAGRYRYFRLHPFSLGELNGADAATVQALLRYGGFPEPLLRQDAVEHRLWQRDRLTRVVREDLRDMERVRDISLLEHLVELLPGRVGSPLSITNLAGDLEVDFKTVQRWLTILENLYVCYRLAPWGAPRVRAVKKEQKLYLWDWSSIEDEGARFENLVGSQLLKYCHLQEDTLGMQMELRYLRDTDGREVDFVVIRNRKPLFAVECKLSDKRPSKALAYFAERTGIPRFYQVHLGSAHFQTGAVTLLPLKRLCEELSLP